MTAHERRVPENAHVIRARTTRTNYARAFRVRVSRALCGALLGALPARAPAQQPVQPTRTQVIRTDTLLRQRPDSIARRDSLRADSLRRDSLQNRGVVPRTPSRTFPEPDSIIQALMAREGFLVTRYMGDSVQLLAEEKEIRLSGKALIERAGSTLEADTVRYVEATCRLSASGAPRLFDTAGTLMGEGMVYDACNKAGIVRNATTDLQHGGGTWVVHGDIAVDNAEERTYARTAEISSCTLIEPHYHFEARQVKWVNKRLMIARPAVLYVADVPIVWLPFVFQDTRRGRRSGILPPQFGVNDIVRFNSGYQRHVSNIGYYFAISDYTDAQVKMDWYASRYTSLSGRFRYRWLDRFLAGGLEVSQLLESGGSSSQRISWSHQQQFSLASQITANIDYASSSRVISRNAVDPILAIGTIDSRLNYQRRAGFGTFNIGGSRTQSLDKPQVSMTFPTAAFTPNPIAISRSVTWSPSFSFTNNVVQRSNPITVARPGGVDTLLTDQRSTSVSISSPLRIGSWTLSNSFSIQDDWNGRRSLDTLYPNPADSSQFVVRSFSEGFRTGVDWNVGFGLPVLFQGTWNLQPGMQLVNTTGGPFALRSQFTQGNYITQGKRAQFNAGMSPTFFGLFPGFGPITRIRHAVSPSVSWAYSPAANVDSAYARALADGRLPTTLRIPARQSISISLSQNFEAKLRPARSPARTTPTPNAAFPRPAARQLDSVALDSLRLLGDSLAGDSTRADSAAVADTARGGQTAEGRKMKLLSIQSGAISYDFEQAKEPGRTGWVTDNWANTISSDLIRGFSVNIAHDLFDGPVGTDSARFKPFLTSVTMGFSVTGNTFGFLRRLFGFTSRGPAAPDTRADSAALDSLNTRNPTDPGRNFTNAFARGPLATQFSTVDRIAPRGAGFSANLNFSLQRPRPVTAPAGGGVIPSASPTNSMLSGSMQFSPTRNWNVSWQTSYNFTQGTFTDHVVRLDRNLHDWRATFTFVRSPNGNFLFNFFIELIAEPDLKFQYDQRNTQQQ